MYYNYVMLVGKVVDKRKVGETDIIAIQVDPNTTVDVIIPTEVTNLMEKIVGNNLGVKGHLVVDNLGITVVADRFVWMGGDELCQIG